MHARDYGYSLLELLMTIAVAALILTLGLPSFAVLKARNGWNEIGTDCGICMAVCPYAHPDHPLHNAIRWGNARSGAFRRAALWLDDLFYGKRPARKPLPEWLKPID